ncbi:MAG: hypothetical protein GY953_29440 [bacterium]|nr:hypothetical protein [bacterium]
MMRTWFLLLLLVTLAAAASPEARRSSIHVPVWSESGEPLKAGELVATVGGEAAGIVHLEGPEAPLMILLVLDLVEDLNEIELAKAALIEAVAGAAENVYFGVLRAQNGLQVLLDPTGDRDEVSRVIEQAPVSGTPGLLETIETASELAGSILADAGVRVAVVYITDSEAEEYRENFANPEINESDSGDLSRRFRDGLVRNRISRLNTKLAASQAPIFAVHLQYDTDRLEEAYQNGILQMAVTTGGTATFCRSNAEIAGAVQAMVEKIIGHYSLELRVPAAVEEDIVEVSLESAAAGKLVYRGRYVLNSR